MSNTLATEESFTFTTDYLKDYTFTMGNISGNWDHIETTLGKEILSKAIENGDVPNNVEMTWSPPTFTAKNVEINKTQIFDRDSTGLSGMMVFANTNIDVHVSKGDKNFVFPKGTPVVLRLLHNDIESVVGIVIFCIDNIFIKKIL
jgi:hypothetical protein